jgi:hypothetical protein
MKELDRKIRETMRAEEAEQLGPFGEPPLFEQAIDAFRGRYRWPNVLTLIGQVACAVFAVVSAICFFRAEGLREILAWAGGFGLSLIAFTTGRIWFWMQVHSNAVTREVKRTQLQIARLASQLKEPK